MNLTGVIGDARKRIEAAAATPPFDLNATCIVCGTRGVHSHAVALGKQIPKAA